MNPLDLVRLTPLMQMTSGAPAVMVGLIDGPVAINHRDLTNKNVREVSNGSPVACVQPSSTACLHGTFVAGILSAKRDSIAPAICPDCTLLVRPIFVETKLQNEQLDSMFVEDRPNASPGDLAAAILDCINAGTRIINLSVALAQPSSKGEREVEEALNHAARRGVLVVAAAGNQGSIGSTAITRHPWVIPVAACDVQGIPISYSNFGSSIGKHGLIAPGDGVTSLGANGKPIALGGTSAAAPFVTGTLALLWSEFPTVIAGDIKLAVTRAHPLRRLTVVPPLLDAWAAYQTMKIHITR